MGFKWPQLHWLVWENHNLRVVGWSKMLPWVLFVYYRLSALFVKIHQFSLYLREAKALGYFIQVMFENDEVINDTRSGLSQFKLHIYFFPQQEILCIMQSPRFCNTSASLLFSRTCVQEDTLMTGKWGAKVSGRIPAPSSATLEFLRTKILC